MPDNYNNILEQLIKLKVKTDASCYFSFNELERYSLGLSLNIDELNNLLCLIPSPRRKNYFYSKNLNKLKEAFFATYHEAYMNYIIKYNIKENSSYSFTLKSINELSNIVEINPEDFTKYFLKSNKYRALVRGDYNSFVCNYYKEQKEEYLNKISEQIINEIVIQKIKTDYSKNFTYEYIQYYSNLYEINIKDFLVYILKINKYKEKKIEEDIPFKSNHYKEIKERYLSQIKNDILESIMLMRIKEDNSYAFHIDDLKKMSYLYGINIRDLMVYILGRSDQLFHDIKARRQDTIYSDDYKAIKEAYIMKKRQALSHMFDQNTRTYYDIKDITYLSSITGINTDDIITYFFDKNKKNLYNIKANYRNRKRISYGEYKCTSLPNDYVTNNYEQLRHITVVAAKAACNFLSLSDNERQNIFEDLVQEGLIYLINNGNPQSNDSFMIRDNDTLYNEDHGKIFYKKCFYKILTCIKKMIVFNTNTGKSYDVSIEIKGCVDDLSDYHLIETINNLSSDEITRKILLYFTQNSFSDNSINELSLNIGISNDEIISRLQDVRKQFDNIYQNKKIR